MKDTTKCGAGNRQHKGKKAEMAHDDDDDDDDDDGGSQASRIRPNTLHLAPPRFKSFLART